MSHPKDYNDQFKTIRISRVIFPALFGLGVVAYLLWHQFDLKSFLEIHWSFHTIFWLGIAVIGFVFRHLAYSWRLRILTNRHFSWKKCIELIFIWEFASAVSPTALGGSATAIILLAQEEYPTAKTVSVILYSMVLDALFFLIALSSLYLIYGSTMIRPKMDLSIHATGYGYTFLFVMIAMLIYGGFFFYGLFINPKKLKQFLLWMGSLPFLKKYRANFEKTGAEIVISAKELYKKDWLFHLKAMSSTAAGWILKFLILNFVYLAIVEFAKTDLYNQVLMYARHHTMYAITAFSPTPGGSGVAEILFNGFFEDFIPVKISVIIMGIWRFLTYYLYLIIGVVVVPNWINKLIIKRRKKRSDR